MSMSTSAANTPDTAKFVPEFLRLRIIRAIPNSKPVYYYKPNIEGLTLQRIDALDKYDAERMFSLETYFKCDKIDGSDRISIRPLSIWLQPRLN